LRTSLLNYIRSMQSAVDGVDGNDLGQKLNEEEMRTISGAVMDGLDWLATNPDAEADEIREKQQELEASCSPIVAQHLGAAAESENAIGSSEEEDNHDEL